MSSEPFIGIDFGTCNSSVAWFNPRTGQAEILLNAEGEQKTPSVVYFGGDGPLVGKYAEERLESVEDRKRVVRAVKRDLAKPRAWCFFDKPITPIHVACLILGKLKHDAEKLHFHEEVKRAVITHPADFDEFERDRLREAAHRAGFQEVSLLDEPIAAAMAYARAGMKVGRNVLVYDLGGGTMDLAFLVRDEDQEPFRLASAPKGDRIGGEDFDRAIYDHFDRKVKKQLGLIVSEEGIDQHLLRRCRDWKESLSITEKPQPFSYWLPKVKKSLKYTLTRKAFERLIDPLVQKTVLLAKEVQREASETGHEPEDLLLIGGSSRVPLISSSLRTELKIEPRQWQMQDLAVALGAAYHANGLWTTHSDLNCAPKSAHFSHRATRADSESFKLLDKGRQFLKQVLQRRQVAADPLVQESALDEALNCAQAACDIRPDSADALCFYGEVLLEKRDWSLAIAAFTAMMKSDPKSALAYFKRGLSKVIAWDYAGAITDLDEALRLGLEPSEKLYRYRAAASFRLGKAAEAVADLRSGIALADEDTPRASLHAVVGLLMRDELASALDAIDSFGEALRQLRVERATCASHKNPLATAQPAISQQEHVGPNYPQFLDSGALFGIAERMNRLVYREQAGIWHVDLVSSLQTALWQVCKAAFRQSTRDAVAAFVSHNPFTINDSLAFAEPGIILCFASVLAEQGKASEAVQWLTYLLKRPGFDIRQAQLDPWLAKSSEIKLRELLTPKWSFVEQHGMLMNSLKVTNQSLFRLTSIHIKVSITRNDGPEGHAKISEEIVLSWPALDAGETHVWGSGVVRDAGMHGRNIDAVCITMTCAEHEGEVPRVRSP